MQDFCNDLCIRILSYLAAWFGMRLVAADATVLPRGWMMVDPALAKQIGINKAVIAQKVNGWVEHNLRKGQNIRNGRAWSYNTIPNWAKEFSWLNERYIGTLLRELEAGGLLVSAKLGAKKSDQTKWYSTAAGALESTVQQMCLWPVENMTLRGRKADDDSSIGTSNSKPSTHKKQTPTPARAITQFGGVGDFPGHVPGSEMPEKMPEVPEVRPDRRDGSDFEDAAESVVNAPTPVARGPFPPMPDDTTEHDETTEEETQSSGDTKPVDIPAHAKIFAIPDAEVRGWIAQDGERLQAWCEYAAAEESVRSPGGLVRTAMRIAGNMPPAGGRTLDLAADSKAWAAALKNSAYADFIET